MKRIICLLAILALALTFAFAASAENAFSAEQTEITAAAGNTITVAIQAGNAKITSLGFKLAENEDLQFVSGKWEFSDDADPDLSEGMTEKDGVIQPAVCAFSEPVTLNGHIFALKLKLADTASGVIEINVTASYTDENMEPVRETITVKVTVEGTVAEASEGGETSETPSEEGTSAAQEGSEVSQAQPASSVPEGGDEGGSGWIVFVVIGAIVVVAAAAAVIIIKKRSK
ncbi:MAG: hypothetical protein J5760_03235 [Clostridia bacterium]|nr:hypothetical protein [Clostridia bacterium]